MSLPRPPLSTDPLLAGASSGSRRWLAALAYVWGMPYVAAARLRQNRTLPDDPFVWPGERSPGAPLNRIGRQRLPSDPSYRVGVGVSTDTLYTSAWLDLADEPQVLETPRIPDRYYSFQIGNADTSTDHVVGSRTHGEDLPPVVILGPDQRGVDVPAHVLTVRTRTRYVNLPGRLLVDPWNPSDLREVHRLQDQISLRPLSAFMAGEPPTDAGPPPQPALPVPDEDDRLSFLHLLGAVLSEERLTEDELGIARRFTSLGLDARTGFDAVVAVPHEEELSAGLEDGQALVAWKSERLGREAAGWTLNVLGPRFGTDHLLRAAVAKDQIYVTLPEEGLYPLARFDGEGHPLTGTRTYRLRFGAGGLPPVEAFWSVTLYDDDGFLVPNALHRCAIGDRTPGLRRDPDGGLTIAIQSQPPDDDANWLPAPDGRFFLMLRLFVPGAEALQGRWLPPPIQPTRVGP